MTVKQIFSKQLKMEEEEINEHASIKYDLGVDSLDLMAIIATLEDIYEIKVDMNEIKDLDTIQEVEDYISKKMQK